MGRERKEIIALFVETSNILYWKMFSDLPNGVIFLVIRETNYWRPAKLHEMESELKSENSRVSPGTDMLAPIRLPAQTSTY